MKGKLKKPEHTNDQQEYGQQHFRRKKKRHLNKSSCRCVKLRLHTTNVGATMRGEINILNPAANPVRKLRAA